MNKYYALEINQREANIYIFADISKASNLSLSQYIKCLDVDTINVYINSYGGDVTEGLAIYNSLKNHKAKVRTICDCVACSVASVVFMAGDERIMNNASLLMIHNEWANETSSTEHLQRRSNAVQAFMERVNIPEKELKEMLTSEAWLLPDESKKMGFATSVLTEAKTDKAVANARKAHFNLTSQALKQLKPKALSDYFSPSSLHVGEC
jgi:ATP-dependent Clp protease protease subunit